MSFSCCVSLNKFVVFVFVTAWKVSKYGVFSGPYFSVFGLNTGPEKNTFYAVNNEHSLHKKLSFPLRISSVNVTKSAVFYRFSQIYLRNP